MVTLPTEKSPPGFTPEKARVLLFGPPKIGKSTLAANFDPDHTLFVACEQGLDALDVYQTPCDNWEQFREIGAALANDAGRFKTVVIDTVNELHRMCAEATNTKLGIQHASDASHGKGWGAINDEWRLRVGKLVSLGIGVWFISHSKDVEVETRTSKVTKTIPTLSGQPREYLTGLVDVILLANSYSGANGEVRQLRTRASENWEAGGRVLLSDPLPLHAKALRLDMQRAADLLNPPAAKKKAAKPAEEKVEVAA